MTPFSIYSLAEETKEWTELQDNIDGLNELLDETELSSESVSSLHARERVEKLNVSTQMCCCIHQYEVGIRYLVKTACILYITKPVQSESNTVSRG